MRSEWNQFVAVAAGLALLCPLAAAAGSGRDEVVVVEKGDENGPVVRKRVVVVEGDGGDPIPGAAAGGFLGIELTPLTPELRAHFGAPAEAGVLVARVLAASPAEAAGLEVGDVVVAVGGVAVADPRALSAALAGRQPGEAVDLAVVRDGSDFSLEAVVGERPARVAMAREVVVDCEGEGECVGAGLELRRAAACGDAAECRVEVRCEGAGCDCTVNGESVDCDALELPRPGE